MAQRLVSDPVKVEVDTADSRHLDIEELIFRGHIYKTLSATGLDRQF